MGTVFLVVSAAALVGGAALAPAASGRPMRADRVVLLLVPSLTWECVSDGPFPTLRRLARAGAVGSLSMRTADPGADDNAVAGTLGAGARTGSPFERQPSFVATGRRAGLDPRDLSELGDAAERARYGAAPGALGSSVATAALVVSPDPLIAAQGVVAMDRTGSVGLVDSLSGAAARAAEVVVATPRDEGATAEAGSAVCAGVPGSSDAAADELSSGLGAGDALVVVASTPRADPERLGVFIAWGAQVPRGSALSASTRAPGFVSVTDVAPTLVAMVGATPSTDFTGEPATVVSGSPTANDLDDLVAADRRAVVRDAAFRWVAGAFAVLCVVTLAATLGARRRGWPGWPVDVLCLWSFAFPAVAFAVAPWPWQRLGPGGLVGLVVGGSLALASVAWSAARRVVSRSTAPLAIFGASWAMLALAGNRIQMSAPLGYSPIDGGRFAGFGNQAFVIFTWSALVVVALSGWLDARGPSSSPLVGWLPAASVLTATLVVDSVYGADVGGALCIVPAAALLWSGLRGRPVRWRTVLWAALAAAAAVIGLGLWDSRRAPQDRTHLGRLFHRLGEPDGRLVFERKFSTMASTFTQPWSVFIVASVAFFAWRLLVPSDRSTAIERAHPHLRPLGVASVALGVGATLLNDSGLRIASVLVAIAVPYACWFSLGGSAP